MTYDGGLQVPADFNKLEQQVCRDTERSFRLSENALAFCRVVELKVESDCGVWRQAALQKMGITKPINIAFRQEMDVLQVHLLGHVRPTLLFGPSK